MPDVVPSTHAAGGYTQTSAHDRQRAAAGAYHRGMQRRRLAAIPFLLLLAAGPTAQAPATPTGPSFDLVLRGGVVHDGSGRPGKRADVGIRGGRIAAIGDVVAAPGTPTLRVDGLAVAPGFIDVHVHVDT